MDHPVIKLTPFEIIQAALVGVMRQTQNINLNRKPVYSSGNQNDWQLHVEGALGEYAVAKYMGLFWNGNLGSLRSNDVGGLEVRTRSRSDYDLILHREDKDTCAYILVTGVNGVYTLRGWILGKDGKLDAYWADPAKDRPAFFVPQRMLKHINELREE